MNYIELINKFWTANEEYSFRTVDIALYFYLLKVNNDCSWKEYFKRNNRKIQVDLDISFNTLKEGRNRLKNARLIDFKTKNGDANVMYTLSNIDEVIDKVTNEVPTRLVPSKDKLNQTKPNNNLIDEKPAATVVATPPKKIVDIEIRKQDFYDDCAMFVEKYGKDMIREFFEYWTEPNKSGKKMRFEDQKFFDMNRRLTTWASKSFNKGNYETTGKNRRTVAPTGSHSSDRL